MPPLCRLKLSRFLLLVTLKYCKFRYQEIKNANKCQISSRL